jgi:hypothetical protein
LLPPSDRPCELAIALLDAGLIRAMCGPSLLFT